MILGKLFKRNFMIRYFSRFTLKETIQDISEAIGLAIGNEGNSASDIAKQYLILASERLKKLIKKESQPVLKTFSVFPDALDTILSSLSKMNSVILKDFSTFAKCFDSFFLSKRHLSELKSMNGEGLELVQNLFWKTFSFDVIYHTLIQGSLSITKGF